MGGGMAGLTTAAILASAGVEVEVLEAEDRPGGRVRTVTHGPFHAEAGAQVLAENDVEFLKHINRFPSISLMELGPSGTDLFNGARRLRLSRIDGKVERWRDVVSLIKFIFGSRGNPVLPSPGPRWCWAYRKAMQKINGLSKLVQFPYQPEAYADLDKLTFGDFLDQFNPQLRPYFDLEFKVTAGELTEKISLFWGIATSKWDDDEKFFWIEQGASALVDALVKELQGRIAMGAKVLQVSPGPRPIVKYLQGENYQQVIPQAAVMATTAYDALQVIDGLDPWKRDALAAVPYCPYISVHLLCTQRFWDEWIPNGFLPCAGTVFADLIDGTRGQQGTEGILVCLIAGPEARNFINAPDEEIVEIVQRDLERVFPATNRYIKESHIFRWPRGISYFPPDLLGMLTRLQQPMGSLFFAGDYTQGAGIFEAMVSGHKTALEVLKFLGRPVHAANI